MAMAVVNQRAREERLEQWVAQYGNAVLRTCFAYLSNAALAEDAMQDTFLKAWYCMEQFEGRNDCSEKTWLMRIAINICHDYHRSKWFRHVDPSKVIGDLPQPIETALPEDRSLLCDILILPEKYKQVILLYYYQEMTLDETAMALHMSRSTVHHRLQRAQELLKRTLTGGNRDE